MPWLLQQNVLKGTAVQQDCFLTHARPCYVQGGDGDSPVEAGNMLWLIQRDFLEGKTVQQMVSEALLPVANPFEDQDIAQVRAEKQYYRDKQRQLLFCSFPTVT